MAKNQTIQHKRSSVATNKPTTAQVAVGELAINFADKSIYTRDASNNIIELARDVTKSSTQPASAATGDLWWNTTDTALKFYNGSSWNNISTAGPSVLPANTTVPVGTTGSGTQASPYSITASVGTGTITVLGTFTITGLAPNQFVPIVDTANTTNGGRFSVNNCIADSTGKLVFTLKFVDYPASAPATSYTAALQIGVGTVYLNAVVSIDTPVLIFPQSVNFPTSLDSASTSWTAAADTLSSTGSLLISTNNSTFSTGPLAVATGATLYTKWAGSAGSGTGIDGAHGATITGGLTSSSGAVSSTSLVIDKTPAAISFTSQTGVGLSSVVTSDTVTISGVNSYVYLTSANTITASIAGGTFTSVPASGSTTYMVNGQTLAIRQTASATSNTPTTVTIAAGGTSGTFTVTTTAVGTINTPSITSPLNAATGMTAKLTITSSAYATTGLVGTHLNTDWQIATDSGFTAGVISSNADTVNKTSWSPSGLTSTTQYWVKVRYRSNDGTAVVSDWSTPVTFTTRSVYLAVAHVTSPYLSVYPFDGTTIGPKLGNPASLPSLNGLAVDFSPSGAHLLVSSSTTPYMSVYPFDGTTIGTKLTNPTTLPGNNASGADFSPTGNHILFGSIAGTPYMSVYPFDAGTNTIGAKLTDPSTLPAGQVWDCVFSPSGNHIALAHTNSPFLSVYQFNGTTNTIGAKLSDPSTLPAGQGVGVAFSPSGNHIALGHATSPFLSVYPFNGTTNTIGTKLTSPTTLPTGTGNDVAFSPSGNHLAVAHATSPFMSVYPFNGTTDTIGTKLNSPTTLPTGTGQDVVFSPSGNHLALVTTTSPYITVYPFNGTTIDTKLNDPSTLPTGQGYGAAFSPD